MCAPTSDIVDNSIRHARELLSKGYDWTTARDALTRVLADLETRDPADPSLSRLRRFIAEGGQAAPAAKPEGANRPRSRPAPRSPAD
jgi:hypothetical protein